jgi:hypothetical protein
MNHDCLPLNFFDSFSAHCSATLLLYPGKMAAFFLRWTMLVACTDRCIVSLYISYCCIGPFGKEEEN